MLNRREEARSARAFVPYLSHGRLVRLGIWLRGPATNIICSFGGRRLESETYAFQKWPNDRSSMSLRARP